MDWNEIEKKLLEKMRRDGTLWHVTNRDVEQIPLSRQREYLKFVGIHLGDLNAKIKAAGSTTEEVPNEIYKLRSNLRYVARQLNRAVKPTPPTFPYSSWPISVLGKF